MADTAAPAAATPRAKKPKGVRKPKVAASHPPIKQMVNAAIRELKERGGSSLPAIKKHIAAHHKVDVVRLAPFIKKYIRTAVTKGILVQVKGKGASGSFRLSASKKAEKAAKPKKVKKPKAKKAKKPRSPKKKTASKVKKAKSPKKTKAPKAKKAPKKKSPKKAAKAKK